VCATAQTRQTDDANMGLRPEDPVRDIGSVIGARVMEFIIWLIVGGVIGWLASLLMKTKDEQGVILNAVVGIVGATLAGLIMSPLVGVGAISQAYSSLPAMLVLFVGAAIALAIVNLMRRGVAR